MKHLYLLTLLLLGAFALGGEHEVVVARPAETTEAVFEMFMGAMRDGDWEGCARWMHRDALAEFHKYFTALAETDETGEVAKLFFGVEKRDEVAALSPEATFARVLRGITTMNPGMGDVFRSMEARVLGTVPEGDVVHLLYRAHIRVEGAAIHNVAVVSFKRDGGRWRALLTGEMEAMIEGLKRRAG